MVGQPTPEHYKDRNGKPISLEQLVRDEPEWAASRIRIMSAELGQQPERNRLTVEEAEHLADSLEQRLDELQKTRRDLDAEILEDLARIEAEEKKDE